MTASTKESITDKRSAILEGTLNLIAERGFHDTPMSKIAKESGVSAGIIYHYFANKDELIKELYKEIKRNLFNAVMMGYSEQASYRERYLYLWKNFIHYYINHPKESKFLEQFENSPYFDPNWQEFFIEEIKPLLNFFEQGIKDDVLKNIHIEIAASLSFGVAALLAKQHLHGTLTLTEEMINDAANASWDAIKW